jgi:hypothetical protein
MLIVPDRCFLEARITANVESEYIVDVFDAGIDHATGMPFLVMELLNGEASASKMHRMRFARCRFSSEAHASASPPKSQSLGPSGEWSAVATT